jgi:hypothetical protein
MIGAEDHAAATRGSAMTRERAHGRTTEGRVVDRQFLTGPNIAARHQVQAVEPGVGVAGVVDRAPVLRIVAPHHVQVVGHRPGIAVEPLAAQPCQFRSTWRRETRTCAFSSYRSTISPARKGQAANSLHWKRAAALFKLPPVGRRRWREGHHQNDVRPPIERPGFLEGARAVSRLPIDDLKRDRGQLSCSVSFWYQYAEPVELIARSAMKFISEAVHAATQY